MSVTVTDELRIKSKPEDIVQGGGDYPVILPSMLHEWLGLVLANTELRRAEKRDVAKAVAEDPAPVIESLVACLARAGVDGSKISEVRIALEAALAVKSERMVVCRCGCRFPVNSFGSGVISAIGHCYMCDARKHATDDALACPDWGPWVVSTGRDGYVALQSVTGAEDAALRVSGNFGGPDGLKAYAERMAAWLNQQIARESDNSVRVPQARVQHAMAKLMELQCSSCTCMTKTPVLSYHAESCRYRVLGELRQEFQTWQQPSAGHAIAAVTKLTEDIGQPL